MSRKPTPQPDIETAFIPAGSTLTPEQTLKVHDLDPVQLTNQQRIEVTVRRSVGKIFLHLSSRTLHRVVDVIWVHDAGQYCPVTRQIDRDDMGAHRHPRIVHRPFDLDDLERFVQVNL